MDAVPVVTCFLRNAGEVLLLCRSEAVGSYTGRWGAVAGHVAPSSEADPSEFDPLDAAHREIREETALDDAVTLVRAGDSFRVVDPDRDRPWLVHPFLFDCARREVRTDAETTEHEWVHPPEILRRETVPDLWGSYEAVRPTVESIVSDDSHGAAWLSVRALEVLRDEAALADAGSWAHLTDLAATLQAARPSMTVLRNRVARAVDAASEHTPAALEAAAIAGIRDAVTADDEAAAAVERISPDAPRVVTLSRSGTVLTALDHVDPAAVLLPESRPGGEGVDVARTLTETTAVTLCHDAGLAQALSGFDADLALVGADTILPDGDVINKVGTRALALAADREGVPLYVAASTAKVAPTRRVELESAGPIADTGATEVTPLFDVTPADLVAGYCTEAGTLDGAAIAARADE